MENVAQETKNAISGAIKIDEKEIGIILTGWYASPSRIP